MADQSLLITNALICNEGRVTPGDVLIRRGRIDKVAREIPPAVSTGSSMRGASTCCPGLSTTRCIFASRG